MTDQQTDNSPRAGTVLGRRPARVAAIDPGSVKTGLVVLHIQPPPPGYVVPSSGAVAVLARHTARPRAREFAVRLAELSHIIHDWVEKARYHWQPELWCVEDPRDFPAAQLRGRGAAVSLGAAFGIACAAVGSGGPCTLVPAQEWIPKTRTGNFVHPMKHKAARAWLRERWPALADLTDDETFAAGVALWAHTKGAMAALYPT